MIGIIGGSGFYEFLDSAIPETVSTPFGDVEVEIGEIDGKQVLFLPRHGKKHSVPPHSINYRANVYAAHLKKVDFLLSSNAVGAMQLKYQVGDFVIVSDIIDRTTDRISTFFDGSDFTVQTNSGKHLEGVVHTDMTECYSKDLRNKILKGSQEIGMKIHEKGVMVVSNGPRFESPSEILGYSRMSGDLIGMTSAPEVFLAKELDIPYASVAIVTNMAAGLQISLSADEVFDIISKKIKDLKKLLRVIISNEKEV